MLLIPCPHCGPRPELEFTYAGEAHIARGADPAALDDAAWEGFLFHRTNPKGDHAERWRHTHGCARFFNAVRNTVTDRFVATYVAGASRPSDPSMNSGESPDAPSVLNPVERWGAA